MKNILQTHPGEVATAIRRHRYEANESGILLRDSKVFLGGALKITDFRDMSSELQAINANTLLTEGLVHALNVIFPPTGGYAQITNWYIAPFSGDYTPDAGLTAADFPEVATEFTAYANATRHQLVIAAAATSPSTGNTANQALMVFNAGGPYNVYGAAIVSQAAKGSVLGKAMACVRLDNPKIGMMGAEKLGLEYVITAADADA